MSVAAKEAVIYKSCLPSFGTAAALADFSFASLAGLLALGFSSVYLAEGEPIAYHHQASV